MPSQEEIAQQQELLAIHRRTMTDWLAQEAKLSLHTPPYVYHGIRECRDNIRRIKQVLRDWGVTVEDYPDDDPAVLTADDVSSPHSTPSTSPVDRLVISEGASRQAEYICYLASERLASLFAQVDPGTLADPRYLRRQGVLLPLGDAAEPAEKERRRKAAISQLAIVLDYLEKTARIGDLAAIVRARGQLNCEWYFVEALFRSGPWEPSTPEVYLSSHIEDFQLLLSCSKSNFTGLQKEGDIYIPTSTNYFLFRGAMELPLHGLVRLAAVDRHEKVLRGTALYLVLSTDLGSLQDAASTD